MSSFWFTSRKGGFREIGYPVDDQVMATATDTVRAIVDGITRGVFPSRPSGRSAPWPGQAAPSFRCHACDPDGLGEAGVDARWKRLVEDEALADPALRAVRELLFGVSVGRGLPGRRARSLVDLSAEQQLPDHQQRPAFVEDFHGLGDRAELSVARSHEIGRAHV